MNVIESVQNNIIFGPIQSRRFGTSLGVDLSPAYKQCDFDCLYCELAPAPAVLKQTDIVSLKTIIKELQKALTEHPHIDVITLTANGEPTLYPYLDELIKKIKALDESYRILILTNSATLTDSSIFNMLLKLDKVKLSLDAISPEIFTKIDRPHKNIDINNLTCKVKEFADIYTKELYIEILFVHGLNDTDKEIQLLNSFLKTLHNVARIDIGTIDRPPAYPVQGISYTDLVNISHKFDSSLPIHIVSREHTESNISSYTDKEIINTLDKRPLTFKDIELLFDKKSKARLQNLIKSKKISIKPNGNLKFLVPTQNLQRKRRKS